MLIYILRSRCVPLYGDMLKSILIVGARSLMDSVNLSACVYVPMKSENMSSTYMLKVTILVM